MPGDTLPQAIKIMSVQAEIEILKYIPKIYKMNIRSTNTMRLLGEVGIYRIRTDGATNAGLFR